MQVQEHLWHLIQSELNTNDGNRILKEIAVNEWDRMKSSVKE